MPTATESMDAVIRERRLHGGDIAALAQSDFDALVRETHLTPDAFGFIVYNDIKICRAVEP